MVMVHFHQNYLKALLTIYNYNPIFPIKKKKKNYKPIFIKIERYVNMYVQRKCG